MSKQILIVGGGPAGMMTALCLAKKNYQITVIDRKAWPIDKVCGEGIMPKGILALKKYGVFEKIELGNLRAFEGISYIDQDLQADGLFNSGRGYVIRRTALSKALYERVQDFSNINLISGIEISGAEEEAEGINVFVRKNKLGQAYQLGKFDYLIGCDGMRSKVRKLAGMDAPPPGKKNRIGARVHYKVAPWSNKVEVHWHKGVECYVAPVSENCVEFIFGWNRDLVKLEKGSREKMEAQLFSFFPKLRTVVENAEKTSNFEVVGPLATGSKGPIQGRVILIGDAALFLDPITGEGMSLAIEQAQILESLFEDLGTKEGVRNLKEKISKVKRRYIFLTKGALFLSVHPVFRAIIMHFFQKFPAFFQICLEANMGNNLFVQRLEEALSYAKEAPTINLGSKIVHFVKTQYNFKQYE